MIAVSKEKSFPVYRRLLRYLYPYRARFTWALLAMTIYGATDGCIPYLLKHVLDDVFGSQDRQKLNVLVGAIVAFAFVRGLMGFFQRYLASSVGLAIVADIRNEINRRLLYLSSSFFAAHPTGTLISRVTNDSLIIRSALTDAAAAVLRDSVRVVALLAVAFYLDPVLASVAVIGFPLGLVPVLRYGKKVRRLSRTGQNQLGGLTSLLQETIVGHNVVQAFTNEEYECSRFEKENELLRQTSLRAEKYSALSAPTNEFLASCAIALVILYGGLSVISGVRTQGDFIAFITSIFLLYEPLKKISNVSGQVQAGVASAERIFQVLDIVPEIKDRPGARAIELTVPHLEYRNVSFHYPLHDLDGSCGSPRSETGMRWALQNVSLQVKPGETLALVGMSGGGKSTLVTLLPRFYDPQDGAILINGCDILDLTLHSLRSHIAVVTQHTFLFNDTVFRNIAYGRPDAKPEEVFAAAKAAHAHEFVLGFANGYESVIGEQGLRVSGGQRARIAIARALLKNAPILVLDEATASLDSESEGLVQDAIDRLMNGRTVLVIAHRLATVRKADRIAVMVNGSVAEIGTHTELLAANAEYAKLYRLQFSHEDMPGEMLDRAAV